MSREPGFIPAVKETYAEFSEDNVMTWAAALAFYAGLSLAPLMTIIAWLVATFMGSSYFKTVEDALVQLLGAEPGKELSRILEQKAAEGGPTFTSAAGIASIAILLFSATGVFAQLQAALNNIWDVRQKPSAGVWGFLRKRFLSLGMVVSVFFLLLVSMFVSAAVQTIISKGLGAGLGLDPTSTWIVFVVEVIISLAILTPLFALMFKYLPDALIRWKHVWLGASITAVLFVVGKIVLGLYLGRGSYESSYGAAVGSFLGLLVWVYYTSLIFFIGAEATQVYAKRRGRPVVPDKHAERIRTVAGPRDDPPPRKNTPPRKGTPSPA